MASWNLILLLIVTLTGEAAKSACPTSCSCYQSGSTTIDCAHAGLVRIPIDLPDPPRLISLDFRFNHVQEIIASIIAYNNLEKLDLSNNQILTIDELVFQNLPKLKHLYLRHNKLYTIDPNTFNNLNSLIKLDLSHNNIDTLQPTVFRDLVNLVELDLSYNVIEGIQSDSFTGLDSLRSISLSSNRLYNISQDWWIGCPQVNTILLDMNQITWVPEAAFHTVENLRSLSMEGNNLESIHHNVFFSHELKGTFLKMPSLAAPTIEKLSLKHNSLQEVPSELLSILSNLVTLDLSQNAMEMIPKHAFKRMNKLRDIFLNALPKLQLIESGSFMDLPSLATLEITSNSKLKTIEESAFIGTPNIEKVDLHNNALTTLSSELLDWRKLQFLDLRNNHWNCDCNLGYIGAILREKLKSINNTGEETQAYIYKNAKCATPDIHKDVALAKLTTECVSLTITEKSDMQNRNGDKADNQNNSSGNMIIIVVVAMVVLCMLTCIIVVIWRTKEFAFNKRENNIPRSSRRRLRRSRRKVIAQANGSLKEMPSNPQDSSDRISITDNMAADDNVFEDDGTSHCSETDSQKAARKVSFSSYVTVRRCSFDDSSLDSVS